jgi:hypothetical protein
MGKDYKLPFEFPVILKPSNSVDYFDHEFPTQHKVYKIDTLDDSSTDDAVLEQAIEYIFTQGGDNSEGVLAFANDFAELNIMPTSISYEYEPCDILKAVELFIKKRQKYIKGKDEDLNSIITGIMQFKGNVHFSFNEPLTADEIGSAAELDSNERFKALAGIIDKKINSNYKLWKTNYMAYDILNSTNEFANMYSSAEKDEFLNYISFKMQSVEEGMEEVEQILLSIYANPVVTRKNMNL